MVMEFWSIIMELSVHLGNINTIKREKLEVSHLLFADDMLVFCKGDKKSAKGLTELLEQFRLNTCLLINKNKSKAFSVKDVETRLKSRIYWAFLMGVSPSNTLGFHYQSHTQKQGISQLCLMLQEPK